MARFARLSLRERKGRRNGPPVVDPPTASDARRVHRGAFDDGERGGRRHVGFAIWKLRPWRRLPTSSASSEEAGGSKASGWTTQASQQLALILATLDAQEPVPEGLKA
jgi:hypothetical protein